MSCLANGAAFGVDERRIAEGVVADVDSAVDSWSPRQPPSDDRMDVLHAGPEHTLAPRRRDTKFGIRQVQLQQVLHNATRPGIPHREQVKTDVEVDLDQVLALGHEKNNDQATKIVVAREEVGR